MRLENKVAIVTGAGRGLGRGIALKLAREGAEVVVGDVVRENAVAVADEITGAGGRAIGVAADISRKADVEAMFAAAAKGFGELDILVNNAGINRDGALHKMTDESWDKVIAVNLTGTFYCLRQAAQIMRERGYGRIVNVASMSWLGNFGQANYAASKAGVVGLTKTAARELAKKGITVNAICPGFVDTEMTRGVPPAVWDAMIGKIWCGRVGSPDDVGNVVAFLASDDAAYVTGEVINVSGGMVL
ncbi:MAG: 3-oxoacyl-ACP reductase FabG [Rhodoplanes sp.]|uniref:3-oxoacyl-ACP reductase FabG n=1 Tax=Rhodoplanes sp. TaxID=1968906 RepID=UPI00184E9FE5|nr:3-oxoacyl-ACP reductase FabG [Rhodoplanes sp.]NVO14803.1 3-oxoacyl-ACP reductase FabG [Rhodoplanes sp.]